MEVTTSTRRSPMDTSNVFTQMRDEHAHVMVELRALEDAAATHAAHEAESADWPGQAVRNVLDLLARQFATHMTAEDELLFPALIQALPETRAGIEPLQADHAALRMMLGDLRDALTKPATSTRNEQVAVALRDFVDLLRIHIRKEELLVF